MKAYECDQNSVDGCFDIFFTESSNGGKTWSVPIPVPRTGMELPLNRTNPKILAINETQQILITYTSLKTGPMNYGVYIVTRPFNSSTLTPERNIGFLPNPVYDLTLTYAILSNQVHLDLFCLSSLQILNFNSKTNGEIWQLTTFLKGPSNYLYSISPSWEKDELYMLTIDEKDGLAIRWKEEDLSWHVRPLKHNVSVTGYRPLVVSLPNMKHSMQITAAIGLSLIHI
eukprot:TRINITY_DN1181_c0_g1_i8.p1 TRINITY_DN1181_c0_g1~~TRINITY_DN1181_c0_g1_i8.p1  ORF type:complete len:228 (-),score=34.22 TRINITY_DN1181_c0_g1_i8:64-747(-)